MRTAVAATALGLTLLASAALAACAPDEPLIPPDSSPSSTPVFASEAEALAAAEGLYGEYQKTVDQLGITGWKDASRLSDFVRGELLEDELAAADSFSEKGYVQIGTTTFDSFSLQRVEDDGPGLVVITAYLCVDVSNVDVLDAAGNSIVASSRPDRQALEIDLDDIDGDLKITRSEAWTGQDFC